MNKLMDKMETLLAVLLVASVPFMIFVAPVIAWKVFGFLPFAAVIAFDVWFLKTATKQED